jgi:hypothetical protein
LTLLLLLSLLPLEEEAADGGIFSLDPLIDAQQKIIQWKQCHTFL